MIIDTTQQNLYYCTGSTRTPGYLARLGWSRSTKTWHFEEIAIFSSSYDPITKRPAGEGTPDKPLIYKKPKTRRFKSKHLSDIIHKVMRTRAHSKSAVAMTSETFVMPLFCANNDRTAIQQVQRWHKVNDVPDFWWDINLGKFIEITRKRFQIEDTDFTTPNPCAEVELPETATKCYASTLELTLDEKREAWLNRYKHQPSTETIDMTDIYKTTHYIYGVPVEDCDVAGTLSRLASEMENIVEERNKLLDIEKSASEIGDETVQLPNSVFKDLEKRMKQCKKAIKKLGGKVG